MVNIAVLVSGGGTNLQALLDAQAAGKLINGRIACVVSSKDGVYALERAKNSRVPAEVVLKKDYVNLGEYDQALLNTLQKYDIGLVVLAGFMSIIGERLIQKYRHAIINVHPSLIPAFCGKGFFGLRVHEQVLHYGVKVTGATVHFVNEIPDGGEIILQKAVPVEEGDTPEALQRRVMEQAEWHLLPEAVSLFCQGKIEVQGRVTKIINRD